MGPEAVRNRFGDSAGEVLYLVFGQGSAFSLSARVFACVPRAGGDQVAHAVVASFSEAFDVELGHQGVEGVSSGNKLAVGVLAEIG
jgi:hypothetical protein